MRVDPTNAEQAHAWNGQEGAYGAENAQHFDRAVAAHHDVLMERAAITSETRVLDIGCGTGQSTRDAARAASHGSAFGVDLSGPMIDLARQYVAKENLRNVNFEQVDAQIHPFPPGSFDLAVSRTGTMFFGDPPAAFQNIARAIRPSGRLVMLVWQGPERNDWFGQLTTALAAGRRLPSPPAGAPGPFGLSDPDRIRNLLTAAGFSDLLLDDLDEPMWFGSDPLDAHRFVVGLMGWMLDGLDEPDRQRALAALESTLTAHAGGDGVTFHSGAWLIEARRS